MEEFVYFSRGVTFCWVSWSPVPVSSVSERQVSLMGAACWKWGLCVLPSSNYPPGMLSWRDLESAFAWRGRSSSVHCGRPSNSLDTLP